MRQGFAGLVLCWVALTGVAVGATPSGDLAETVFGRVKATPAECPAGLATLGVVERGVCGVTNTRFKDVKRQLKSLLRKHDDVVTLPGSMWVNQGIHRLQRFFLAKELYVLVFDTETGMLALMPQRPCFEPMRLEDPELYGNHDEGVEPPRRVERTQPAYPAKARADRTSGLVVVQAVVGHDGRIAETCVGYAVPEGYGFEEEAGRTVRQWRYEPARRDGAPVDFLTSVIVTWEIR